MAPSREGPTKFESTHKKSKMKRKRSDNSSKCGTTEGNETPKKQLKTDFTEIEFKVMIKDPNTKFPGTRVHESLLQVPQLLALGLAA